MVVAMAKVVGFYTLEDTVLVEAFGSLKSANTWPDRNNFYRVEYDHLTLDQVKTLSYTQATFFEVVMTARRNTNDNL
jgi:hypothetical protein